MEHAKLEKMGEVPVDLSLALQSYEKSGRIPTGSRVTAVTIYYEHAATQAEEADELLTLGGDNGKSLGSSRAALAIQRDMADSPHRSRDTITPWDPDLGDEIHYR